MKYSKRDRKDAALICAIAASGGAWNRRERRRDIGNDEIGRAVHASLPAMELASEAFACVCDSAGNELSLSEIDAEAALLIEEDWSPGDPVVRIGGAP